MYSVERLLLQEGNPISRVFQNIDPPTPLSARRVFTPRLSWGGGGGHTRGRTGGWGVNILEDEGHRIAILQ
jgi:hypothetical protein